MTLDIEDGGAKGVYEVEVLYQMVNSPNKITTANSIITGVSIGSLNAGLATNYQLGQEKAMGQ